MTTTTYKIDLKWSLWCNDRSVFDDYGALDAYKAMYNYFHEVKNNDSIHWTLHIETAPKKEIRFGTVDFTEEGVSVNFSTEWDEFYETLDLIEEKMGTPMSEEQRNYLLNEVNTEDWFGGWGVERSAAFQYENFQTLDDLLLAIDKVEEDLLDADKKAWALVENWQKNMAESFDEQNKEEA